VSRFLVPAVKLTLKGRKVTVKGPRGVLTKDFSHVRLDLQLLNDGRKLRAEMWFGVRKSLACIRTVMSSVQNMMTGVTKGFVRKMRMVYAHFPIAVTIENDGKLVSVRNFLGEKKPRDVPIHDGVKVTRSDDVKDEITLVGNDVTAVSQAGMILC